ncbi:atrial natriuretic peptide-converting enzyme [Patella vulgata]|uniref:atrial natriuretic peptide-converting enzyme n=1 Tax=Patella vulgata TaxID=6465 RepID=UPI0024A93E14|nr:atrial natriuretic peptide-converting enzyme [Patella vulgata]XP_050389587.2 atrial natriuretic peptide-converting enzyme [Patella vulgata]
MSSSSINNNNNIKDVPRMKVKFSALQIDEDLGKSQTSIFSRQRVLTCCLILILSGLVLGGVSLGVGLYLLGQQNSQEAPPVTNVTNKPDKTSTTHLPPFTSTPTIMISPTSTASPETTTSETTPSIFTIEGENTPSSTTEMVTTVPSSTATTSTPTTPKITASESTTSTQKPACKSIEFTCGSGECVKSSQVCDGKLNCHDHTDEYYCTVCKGFRCADGLCLPRSDSRCNDVFDCVDLSDEKNCPTIYGHKQCNNTVQVEPSLVCNGFDDCGDNSDEQNCKCFGGRYRCPDGKCILREWMCDGYQDCVNGTDEQNCNKCGTQWYSCNDYTCRDWSLVCNGVKDCPDAEDEKNCVSVGSGFLLKDLKVKVQDESFYVCSENWKPSLSQQICKYQGFDNVSKVDFNTTEDKNVKWMTIANVENVSTNEKTPIINIFNVSAACSTKKYVRLACHMTECGERKVSFLQPFIAGGELVPVGKWPWVVSLSYKGGASCAGALISPEWIITAAHCVYSPDNFDYTETPSDSTILLGSPNRKTGTKIRASKIHRHPGIEVTSGGNVLNDIALIKLAHPVSYTETIQPICLTGEQNLSDSNCYLAGWGLISWRQYMTIEDLRDTKMLIWDDARCSRNTVSGETLVNTNATICTGYMRPGLPTGCQGDSGGPLMCMNSRGRWSLLGIMSSGSHHCGQIARHFRANRFMRIEYYRSWMEDIIKQD